MVDGFQWCHRSHYPEQPEGQTESRGLSQLDGYKRGLVNSLTGNLQKFGLDRVAKVESLEEIFSEADEPVRIRSRIVQKR